MRSGCHGQILLRVFWVVECWIFLVSCQGREQNRGNKQSHVSYKGTNFIHEGSAHMASSRPNYFSKAPSHIITLGGGGFQFWMDTNFQSITVGIIIFIWNLIKTSNSDILLLWLKYWSFPFLQVSFSPHF